MVSLGLQTQKGISDCSLGQLIIFCLSLILRATYNTPSTVGGTHEAPSMLRANSDMRTKYSAERSTIGIMAFLHEVMPLELNLQRPQLVAQLGDGRDITSATPLPGMVETSHLRSLHVSGPFNGPQTLRSPTLTNTSPSRTREAGWPSIPLLPGPLGQLKM
jgi:hypothetical protein